MEYAELTGSRTHPLPAHSPWSGGSKRWLKLVTSLSRLLTPLNVCSSAPAAPEVDVATLGGCDASARALDGRCRTSFERVDSACVSALRVTWTCGAEPRCATGADGDDGRLGTADVAGATVN